MTNPKYKPTTINLTPQEYRRLKLLASIRGQSISAFVRYLVELHLKASEGLIPVIEGMLKSKKEVI